MPDAPLKPTLKPDPEKPWLGILQPEGFPPLPSDWTSEPETFESAATGLNLFLIRHARTTPRKLSGEGAVRRVLVVSHGMGEHGGRYLHFVHYLRDSVDAIYCADHRGHGRSEGLRGHVDRFENLTEDLAQVIHRVKRREPGAEIHLFGHSLGGLIALKCAFDFPKLGLKSLALSSPLLGIKVDAPLTKKLAGRALSRLWPTIQFTNEIPPGDLSHDEAVVRAYEQDRLVHNKITPRMYTEMTRALSETGKRENGLKPPMLMLLPEEDRVTDSAAAARFFERLEQKKKELINYPGFFHESFNELGKEKAFGDLEKWLTRNRSEKN